MKRCKKIYGRNPVGITYWYAKKRKGKELVTVTYVVQDFTGLRFSGHSQPENVFSTEL